MQIKFIELNSMSDPTKGPADHPINITNPVIWTQVLAPSAVYPGIGNILSYYWIRFNLTVNCYMRLVIQVDLDICFHKIRI